MLTQTYDLDPLERLTVDLGADALLVNQSFGMEVTFALPGIAERAMYFRLAPLWGGGHAHNSFGVTATATHWGLAEGRVGMTGNYQTYILLANPNTAPSEVTITFLREDGTTLVKNLTLQPEAPFNVAVGGPETSEIENEAFSAVIAATVPIAVERAMYSDLNGVTWQAGTNATATRLP